MNYINLTFVYCYAFVWGIGESLVLQSRERLDSIVKDFFSNLNLPLHNSIFDLKLVKKGDTWRFLLFEDKIPKFKYYKDILYINIFVHTVDTIKFSYLLEKLILQHTPTFITGKTGVGKTVIIKQTLAKLAETGLITPLFLNFSAQTSPIAVQGSIESKLVKKF